MLVTLTTFFHEQLAAVGQLSSAAETRLIFLGLFWGGVCGCVGIMVAVMGILRDSTNDQNLNLAPTILILIGALALFFSLLYSSIRSTDPERIRPGEIITI